MRFVWAVAAFLVAAVLIGFGIAQRTVFLGATTTVSEVTVDEELPFTLVDGGVLTSLDGPQTLTADGSGEVFAAYGRSADMRAWLSDTPYNLISVDDDGTVVSTVVEPDPAVVPEEDAPGDGATDDAAPEDGATQEDAEAGDAADAAAGDDAATQGRNPAGSDLWLEQYTQEDGLLLRLQLPDTVSVLIATDGTEPAPATVRVTWPIDNATPWAGPLLVGGGVLLVVGLVLYLLGIRHVRRSKGPRRKGLPLLPTQPIDTLDSAEAKGVVSAGKPSRRAIAGRRSFVAVPLVVATALVVTGCSPEAWPQFGASPTPTPTPTVVSTETVQAPALAESQAQRILADIAATVATADETLDADLAATRIGDAVLEVRQANYTIRSEVGEYPAPAAIPTEPLEIVLPEANDGWPRTVMAVVGDPEDTEVAPSLLVLAQTDPWSDYRLVYLASMAASAELPDVAPTTIGAARVPPESSFLMMSPQDLASAYADVIDRGAESEYASMFDETSDRFREKVAEDRRTRLDMFNETGSDTGSLTFSTAAGTFGPVGLATIESGAIVAVSVVDTDTVQATDPDAVIKLDGNQTVQALSGTTQSATGFTTNFSDQLFFYVPNQASGGKIQLLGFSSNVVSAGVIE